MAEVVFRNQEYSAEVSRWDPHLAPLHQRKGVKETCSAAAEDVLRISCKHNAWHRCQAGSKSLCQRRLTVKTVMLNLNIFIKWGNTPWNSASFHNFYHSWGDSTPGGSGHCAAAGLSLCTLLQHPSNTDKSQPFTPQCWAPETLLFAL